MGLMDDGNQIVLGRWMYDEKELPELSSQDPWLPQEPSRPLGKQGEPVIIPRELLKRSHTHVRGKTGSGKDSRILLPLMLQLLKPYELTWTEEGGTTRSDTERDALVVVDLGGDKSTFSAVKAFADADPHREFKFLSLDANHSMKFDPFQSVPDDGHRIIRLCNLFLEAFSLDHGLAYGGSYYSQQNLLLLLSVCEQLIATKRGGRDLTLRDVDRHLAEQVQHNRDAIQIRGIFRFLLEYSQLQPGSDDKDVINLKKSIENRDIVYAFVPSISEATTARQIAGLMLFSTVGAAMNLYEQRDNSSQDQRPHPHTHVVVNEFQTICGASFESLLTGARKYNLSMVMANQTTESLKIRNLDLASTVRDNCALRLYQTVTGKADIDELLTFSRETTRSLKTKKGKESIRVKGKSALSSSSESEQVTSQLSKAEILDISATEGACLAIIEDGAGHREPIPMQTDYAITKAEYLKYRAAPLPKTKRTTNPVARYGTLTSSMALWRSHHLDPDKDETHRERIERFTALLARLAAEELPRAPGET